MAVMYRIIRFEGTASRLEQQLQNSIVPGLEYNVGVSPRDYLRFKVIDVESLDGVAMLDDKLRPALDKCEPFNQGCITQKQFNRAVEQEKIEDPRDGKNGRF